MPQGNSEFAVHFRTARAHMPHWRFWVLVVASVLLGFALVAPFLFLISRDQIGLRGFLLSCLWELILPLVMFLVVYRIARQMMVEVGRSDHWRNRLWRIATNAFGLLLFRLSDWSASVSS
jgi:hypothetical protein